MSFIQTAFGNVHFFGTNYRLFTATSKNECHKIANPEDSQSKKCQSYVG